jgi:hypothetical protein
MFTFGWFSSGRDQAAIDLFNAAADRLARGFIPGRLAYVCDRAPGETAAPGPGPVGSGGGIFEAGVSSQYSVINGQGRVK